MKIEQPSVSPRLAGLRNTAVGTAGLLGLGALFYVLARASNILGSVPCLLNDLYGGASSECRAAEASGRLDPWAPYVVALFGVYVFGSIAYLFVGSVRDREWKSAGLVLLWVLGLAVIFLLERHR